MTAGRPLGFTDPFSGSAGWRARYGDAEVSQFRAAEMIAAKWSVSRAAMEEFAVRSHERAIAARAEGRFAREIEPVAGVTADEGPRAPDLDKIRSLPPLIEGGTVTAATSSQLSDAAAALLIVSERGLRVHGLTPRARVHHLSVLGADPLWMLTAPIPATARALAKTGLTMDDIDLVEINEAFAPVVLAWLAETGADPARVNVNGGAIALGHPLGATGARLMTTLLHELERRGGRYGLQTMCEGGGQANVTIIERLWHRMDRPGRPERARRGRHRRDARHRPRHRAGVRRGGRVRGGVRQERAVVAAGRAALRRRRRARPGPGAARRRSGGGVATAGSTCWSTTPAARPRPTRPRSRRGSCGRSSS